MAIVKKETDEWDREEWDIHIHNLMTIFDSELYDNRVRFMYYFLLHHVNPSVSEKSRNRFTWQDSYFKAVLQFNDYQMTRCRRILLRYGFLVKRPKRSNDGKEIKIFYEIPNMRQ
jgi:hypothetical protein